jgi:hypothetical protein
LLVAVDPILCHQSGQIMSETLATTLAVLCLVLLTWIDGPRSARFAALAGGAIALAALCRPVFIVWLCLVALLLLRRRSSPLRTRLASCSALLAGAAVVLVPWTARNTWQLGGTVILTTHGGYTLLLGNNPDFYAHLNSSDWRLPWDSRAFERAWDESTRREGDRPVVLDQIAYRRAWQNIVADPWMFLRSVAVRWERLWGVLPRSTHTAGTQRAGLLRCVVAAWYAMQWVLVGVGLFFLKSRGCREPWMWGTSLCVALTLVHAFYWTDMRMRAPLVPVLCLLAVQGCAELASRRMRPARGDA